MNKKFVRSRKDRVISGICGGLAALSGLPTWLIRVLLVLIALTDDLLVPVVIAYVVLACVLPEENSTVEYTVDGQPGQGDFKVPQGHVFSGDKGKLWGLAGGVLVVWGLSMLVREIFHISLSQYVLPLLLVVGGAGLIWWALGKKK